MFTKVVTSVMVGALLSAGLSPMMAGASEPENAPQAAVDAIQAVAPSVLENVVVGDGSPVAESASDDLSADVSMPTSPQDDVMMSGGGQSLSIGLPTESDSGSAVTVAPGVSAFVNPNGSVVVPVEKENGVVQITTVLDGADSPQRYEYSLGMPDGFSPQLQVDGSILLTDGSAVIGAIAAPWALDANGATVPTWYETTPTSVVQVVDLSGGGIAFPVVADPSVSFFWWGYAIKYTRSETRQIAASADDAQLVALMCGLIVLPMGTTACLAGATAVIRIYVSVIKTAAANGNCIQWNYPYAYVPYVPPLVFEVTC